MKTGVDCVGVATSFFCHDGKGKFLLHKRSEKCRDERGTWDNGGGQLEFGLNLEENVLKEVREEYGCKGVIQNQLPAYTLLRKNPEGKSSHWIVIPFIILIQESDKKKVIIGDPEKMADIGWYSFDHLPHPLHPGFRKKVRLYKKILEKYSK